MLGNKASPAHVPISRERALANILRGAVTDSPYSHQYGVKHDLVKSMPDEQIIAAAKDAWEWKRGLRDRIAKGRPETLQIP